MREAVVRPILARLGRLLRERFHRAQRLDFGQLRRLRPVSSVFGYDRGRPIDRCYIENSVARHADDIRGRVLEIGDARYRRKFGADRVTRSEVLHIVPGNPQATLVADLATGKGIPEDAFDCVILTQTLHLIL